MAEHAWGLVKYVIEITSVSSHHRQAKPTTAHGTKVPRIHMISIMLYIGYQGDHAIISLRHTL